MVGKSAGDTEAAKGDARKTVAGRRPQRSGLAGGWPPRTPAAREESREAHIHHGGSLISAHGGQSLRVVCEDKRPRAHSSDGHRQKAIRRLRLHIQRGHSRLKIHTHTHTHLRRGCSHVCTYIARHRNRDWCIEAHSKVQGILRCSETSQKLTTSKNRKQKAYLYPVEQAEVHRGIHVRLQLWSIRHSGQS